MTDIEELSKNFLACVKDLSNELEETTKNLESLSIKKSNIEKKLESFQELISMHQKEDSNVPAQLLRATFKVDPDGDELEETTKTLERLSIKKSNIDPDGDEDEDVTNINQLNIEGTPKFGDILDLSGYRCYNWLGVVGKNGNIERSNTTIGHKGDVERGFTIPLNICKYLKDPVKKYSKLHLLTENLHYITGYELNYENYLVQDSVKRGSEVALNSLYVYMCNASEIDKWTLYAYDDKYNEIEIE